MHNMINFDDATGKITIKHNSHTIQVIHTFEIIHTEY